MKTIYFEQAHRDEQRRSEWRRLDESLRQRKESASGHATMLRSVISYWRAKSGGKQAR